MANIPILGQTNPMTDVPDFDSLSEEEQEALAKKAKEAGAGDPVSTAYLVVIDRDGSVSATTDLFAAHSLIPDREATPMDIIGSTSVVGTTVAAQVTAQMTQQSMLQMSRQMMQAQQEAALRGKLRL